MQSPGGEDGQAQDEAFYRDIETAMALSSNECQADTAYGDGEDDQELEAALEISRQSAAAEAANTSSCFSAGWWMSAGQPTAQHAAQISIGSAALPQRCSDTQPDSLTITITETGSNSLSDTIQVGVIAKERDSFQISKTSFCVNSPL